MLSSWGFIFTLGADPGPLVAVEVAGPPCRLWAVGVGSVDEVEDAVRLLVAKEVQLIELCGAFGAAGAARAEAAAGGVPIGAVLYDAGQTEGLHAIFGSG